MKHHFNRYSAAMSQPISEGYRLLHRDLTEVSYTDLAAFLALKMRETQLYDYKHDFPKDGADLAKTMAAFANTVGGVLIIGVAQDKNTGGPSDVLGVDGGENALVERVQQIGLRHIFPALPIEAKAITIPDGNPAAGRRVVIVRIHASPQAPHVMVDTNAIYVRTGDISHPEKFPELRWLEYLQQRRSAPEALRKQLWDDSMALAERYANSEASRSLWWFILSASPTYPFREIKTEREVQAIMSDLVGKSLPCPGGVVQRTVAGTDEGKGVEITRIHATGYVFKAWAFPSFLQTESGNWLAGLIAQGWQLGAQALRKMGWSGHVSIRAEFRNVLGRRLSKNEPFQSVVNEVTAEEQVLAREMLDPEQGIAAAVRLLDRLIWGIGHEGYGAEVATKWIMEELSK